MTRRSLATVMRWTVGMTIGGLRYLRDRPDVRHQVVDGDDCDLRARDLPPGMPSVQPATAGVGPLYHRRYEIRIEDAALSPEEVMTALTDDPNRASPIEYALFDRVGGGFEMELGSDHVVRLPGPWNGPVRVVDVTPTSFRLVTLDGHLEAGEIEFRAHLGDDGLLSVVIESLARSGDGVIDLLYTRLGVAREMQLAMWLHFLRRSAAIAGGRVLPPIHVVTHVHGDAA